ncbi:MAG: cysteine-rich CWC family protein [Planctomycetota bacterium]
MCDRMCEGGRTASLPGAGEPPSLGPGDCPICGAPNDCAMVAGRTPASCWCMTVGDIPEALRIEAQRRGGDERCICEACITAYRTTGRIRRMVA